MCSTTAADGGAGGGWLSDWRTYVGVWVGEEGNVVIGEVNGDWQEILVEWVFNREILNVWSQCHVTCDGGPVMMEILFFLSDI